MALSTTASMVIRDHGYADISIEYRQGVVAISQCAKTVVISADDMPDLIIGLIQIAGHHDAMRAPVSRVNNEGMH